MKHYTCALAWAYLFFFFTQAAASETPRPNIVVIMADDLGFSDLGCYGGEIQTPHLDRLASQSTRLVNFRVNPMCVVTRTSLLTGHEHSQSQNYQRSLPLPRALANVGYQTSISGKWHQPNHPMDHGFDQFYGFLGGQINNFTGSGQIVRQRESEVVPDDWFATDAFTTHTIASIEKAIEADQPFFAYLAFNAPHTPLNAPKDWIEKYNGRFDAGWEVLRTKRFERLRKLGLIDDRYRETPPTADVRPWDQLPESFRKLEAFRMQTYAAVVDNLDANVGRLLQFLDDKNVTDNTLVVFLSDNGGDYGNGDIATDHQVKPWDRDAVPHMSNGWARLKCTPFRFYKSSAHEGGLRVPMIVRWPAGMAKHTAGSILEHQTHVSDLYPTLLQVAGAAYDPTDQQAPLLGESLVPLLQDPDLPILDTEHAVPWAFNNTTRGYLDYPWKIVSINEGPWRLYDLSMDPCEIENMAAQHPQTLERLASAWDKFTRTQFTPPTWRTPLRDDQHGWGFHRLTISCPFVTSRPLCSQSDVPLDTELSFTFQDSLDFNNSDNKTVRLYRVSDPEHPVWTADPDAEHPAQGKRTVTWNDLPTLEPDTAYFLLTDRGWASCGGKPLAALNDGAYWFRFRTRKSP
ncbi:MAG: sulfatase-like hydrolase/transferase [Pirellulaceae bacterium]